MPLKLNVRDEILTNEESKNLCISLWAISLAPTELRELARPYFDDLKWIAFVPSDLVDKDNHDMKELFKADIMIILTVDDGYLLMGSD